MVKMLFASNNIVHFPTSTALSTAGTFTPDRVPYSIGLRNNQVVHSPIFTPSSVEETWFHFKFYPGLTSFNGGELLFSGYDAANHLLFALSKATNDFTPNINLKVYNGNTVLNVNSSFPITAGIMNNIDIKFTVNLVTIAVDLYINGGLAASLSFGTNPNSYGKPNKFRLSTAFTSGADAYSFFSEIFVTETDSRNGKLHLLRPTGAGALNDWIGSLATLVDEDSASGITTTEPNAPQTTLLTPYVGPSNISNVAIITSTSRGINSPTKLKHLMRVSGINYESAELPVDPSLQYNITDFAINPATSLPWDSADLSAIETGFLSVA